jgi:hypothetical protein
MLVDSTDVEQTAAVPAKLSIDVESTTIEKRTVRLNTCTGRDGSLAELRKAN